MILTGDKEFYKGIGAITFEGKESDNPLSFKYYDPERKVTVSYTHLTLPTKRIV